MLQAIRNRLTGWIAIAIIILIGVPLALTFGTGDFTAPGADYAARVNGEEIPRIQFDRVYQDRLSAQRQELRGLVSPELERELKRGVLDSFVINRVLSQHVTDAGYRVSDQRVAEQIRSLPAFQVGGQFSRPAYEAALNAEGLAPTAFETEQRLLLSMRQFQDGLLESAFYTPVEFRRLIELEGQRREVSWVIFDAASIGAGIDVSDLDVQSYYSANQNQFQTQESADLEYIEVVLADMARDYEPDEQALLEAYEADPTRFRSGEERRARHILLAISGERDEQATRAIADEVAEKLAAGADFAALAGEYSNDPGSAARGGDLGWAGRDAYVPAFEEALFAMDVGETTPPVRTEFGYHLIRLEEVRRGEEQKFEDVRDQLAAELRQHRAQDEFYGLAERLDDLALDNPTSLEPAAQDTGLPLRRLAGYTRSGGGPFGDDARLASAVFTTAVLEGEENTPLIELDDGRAVVARVAMHRPRQAVPLTQVRDEIIGRLRTLRASTEAAARGEALLQATASGTDFAEAATAAGERVVDPGTVARQSPAVPTDLLLAIFRAPRPAAGQPIVQGTPLSDGGYAVFRLTNVANGQPDAVPQELRDQRKRILAQQTAIVETNALVSELRNRAKVVVAKNLFESADDDL